MAVGNSLLELRVLVGFLGEKDQFGWWKSAFLAPVSDGFLRPVFPKTKELAKLTGVVAAAARLHDERIGRGRVFHIFRLPEEIEFRQHELMRAEGALNSIEDALGSSEAAMARLAEIAGASAEAKNGPVQLGDQSVLSSDAWISEAAAIYHSAFSKQTQAFPYWSRTDRDEEVA